MAHRSGDGDVGSHEAEPKSCAGGKTDAHRAEDARATTVDRGAEKKLFEAHFWFCPDRSWWASFLIEHAGVAVSYVIYLRNGQFTGTKNSLHLFTGFYHWTFFVRRISTISLGAAMPRLVLDACPMTSGYLRRRRSAA